MFKTRFKKKTKIFRDKILRENLAKFICVKIKIQKQIRYRFYNFYFVNYFYFFFNLIFFNNFLIDLIFNIFTGELENQIL